MENKEIKKMKYYDNFNLILDIIKTIIIAVIGFILIKAILK